MTWEAATLAAALDAAASLAVLSASAIACIVAAVVLLVAGASYRLGVRHRERQARQLRERLVGRLHPGVPLR